jgi:hypothetical protein
MAKSKALIPVVVDKPARSTAGLSRREYNRQRRDQVMQVTRDLALAALSNPIFTGLSALAINQILYKSGFYNGTPAEAKITGALGIPEPIWFTIGKPPSDADSMAAIAATRANVISAFIIAGCGAWAASKALSNVNLGEIAAVAGALK